MTGTAQSGQVRHRDADLIWTYPFPEQVEARCRRRHPDLTDREWKLIDQGLREWFLCCAWGDGEMLGMPSRLVDEAWHEFTLDSLAYADFCERAFGYYLLHGPKASMATPMPGAMDATTRAWERSGAGAPSGTVLWGLDALLGLPPESLSRGKRQKAEMKSDFRDRSA